MSLSSFIYHNLELDTFKSLISNQ